MTRADIELSVSEIAAQLLTNPPPGTPRYRVVCFRESSKVPEPEIGIERWVTYERCRNELKKNSTCPSLAITKAGLKHVFKNIAFLTNSFKEQKNRSVSILGLFHHYRLEF